MSDAHPSPSPASWLPEWVSGGAILTAVLAGLITAATLNFLLFHCLAELFSVAVASVLFIIAWHTRAINQSVFLAALGLSFAAPAALDLIHTLSYPGMGIFPTAAPGAGTQYWIAARFVQALSFLTAALLIPRQTLPPAGPMLLGQGVVVSFMVVAVQSGWMPACFDLETGLTPFKVASEYVICALITLACGVLIRHRLHLDPTVFGLVLAGFMVGIVQELVFTLYIDPYGVTNVIGHFLKILSFYLIYKALVVTALRRPYELMFLRLSRSEQALRDHLSGLEETVARRTSQLQDSEGRWRALLECSNDWFWATDSEGRIVELSGRAAGSLGDAAPWLGRRFADLPDAMRGAEDFPLLHAAMTERAPFRQLSFPLDSGALPGHWVSVSGRPRFDGDGRFLGYQGAVSDITEKRRTAEAARQKQTMAALGGLVGGLAHEINNLLQPVISFSELVLARTTGDERTRTFLTAIRDSGLSARAIMRDVLAFARTEMSESTPGNPAEAVRSALRLIHPTLPPGIQLKVSVADGLPAVTATATELGQILLNLIQNARDAMPIGGSLTIAAGALTLDPGMAVRLDQQPGAYVRLTVADTGVGMDEATRRRVFEPFFTTKPVGQGTGLGLSVVYGIIHNRGGMVTVDSSPEHGTTMIIDLPAAVECHTKGA